MPECNKCGEPVSVPDGHDWVDGDVCWACKERAYRRLLKQIYDVLVHPTKVNSEHSYEEGADAGRRWKNEVQSLLGLGDDYEPN